jgi:hypothetical protein
VQPQPHASWHSRVSEVALTLAVALATTTYAAHAASQALKIDGSDPVAFAASVAALQNDQRLTRRREELARALAIIWLSNTRDPDDFDGDGDYDVDDLWEMRDDSADLLADIERGDLLPAIEELEDPEGEYKTADYFRQLDGLGYDEVLALVDPLNASQTGFLAGYKWESLCGPNAIFVGSKMCPHYPRIRDRRLGPPVQRPELVGDQVFRTITTATLDDAVEALYAQQYAQAKATVQRLQADQMQPYERAVTERVLASISYAEHDYGGARGHLMNALETNTLSSETKAEIQGFIDWVERRGDPRDSGD